MEFTNDDVAAAIKAVCQDLEALLIDKNRKYGNSAISPLRIFSRATTLEQLNVRMDDKLSRIRNLQVDDREDAEHDLTGYLILKLAAKRLFSTPGSPNPAPLAAQPAPDSPARPAGGKPAAAPYPPRIQSFPFRPQVRNTFDPEQQMVFGQQVGPLITYENGFRHHFSTYGPGSTVTD